MILNDIQEPLGKKKLNFNFPNYKIVDYRTTYDRIMQFNKNKSEPIHRWYPFVEGYSKEFINGIIEELPYKVDMALEPFAGSGTTPLELQRLNIPCIAFEVSPFMHLLATVKLEKDYNYDFTETLVKFFKKKLEGEFLPIKDLMPLPLAKTFQPSKMNEKWVFNRTVMRGILDIKYFINQINEEKYQKLFKIVLASILLEVSNVYRNGKCLSYKKGWKDRKIPRRAVHKLFIRKLENLVLPDLKNNDDSGIHVRNLDRCIFGDVRTLLNVVPDNSIDLVITSPPYLNSRDYTDIYLTELWMLDLVNDYQDVRDLRAGTLFSHVQIKRELYTPLQIGRLRNVYEKIGEHKAKFWNSQLLNMIEGYFGDINQVLLLIFQKMKQNRRIYFNVANSAYYGQEISVDEIISEIAENIGFEIMEIREARRLSPSGQQKEAIDYLRESVIVMRKR